MPRQAHNEDNLPKWAQTELRVLRMRLDEAKDRIAELSGDWSDAAVVADPYAEHPVAVGGLRDVIRFYMDDEQKDRLDVSVRAANDGERYLEIHGWGSVSVMPRSSNVVWITSTR